MRNGTEGGWTDNIQQQQQKNTDCNLRYAFEKSARIESTTTWTTNNEVVGKCVSEFADRKEIKEE